ncbi:hypothetical protein HYH03_013589 [Edaphochlamys debaryana]|uniref:Uncharacterized protein n=1 Tax=Edaphochlamys debaryana TaxID=47281 RepID=A0A835XY09_9CHLO|nr:hypothetical protein HYH03_013587 [Edaphochlamys debaryana]KAG2487744.1 hypothetical protein HYH03_013589 [Edaphochlamys debaryana]|eukprot:KAG2487742.1 hypothetical protein HYH03_013587 [Edaphochlamys debaryana]
MGAWLQRGVNRLPAFVLGLLQTYERWEYDSMMYYMLGIWFSILSASIPSVKMRIVEVDIALVYGMYLLYSQRTMIADGQLLKLDPLSKRALSTLVHPEFITAVQPHIMGCLLPLPDRATEDSRAAARQVRAHLTSAHRELWTPCAKLCLTAAEGKLFQDAAAFLDTTLKTDVSRWWV